MLSSYLYKDNWGTMMIIRVCWIWMGQIKRETSRVPVFVAAAFFFKLTRRGGSSLIACLTPLIILKTMTNLLVYRSN